MACIVACPDPELLVTLLVALAGGADSMAAVAAFAHDHQAWFWLWVPLGETIPSRDTYLRLMRRLDPKMAVKAAFDDAERGAFAPQVQDRCETVERNSGRRERCLCTVLGGPGLGEWVAHPEEWPGLRSLIRVQAEHIGPRSRRQRSVRYYISGRRTRRPLLALVRGHWGVENSLHRTLDVQFREDDCRMRTGHAPAVMVILRRTVLNMLRTI